MFSSSFDHRLLAWDANTGRVVASFDGHEGGVSGLGLNAKRRWLVAGDSEGSFRLWDTSPLAHRAKPSGHQGPVIGVAATPDGKVLVSGGDDGVMRVWEIASGRQLAAGHGHGDVIFRVAVSPNGRRAASASMDGTARIWLLPAAHLERVLVGHRGSVNSVAFVDNERVVTAGWDGTARLWRIEDGVCVGVLKIGQPAMAVAVAPSAELLVAGGMKGALRLWRAPFSGPGRDRSLQTPRVLDLAFGDNNLSVAAGTYNSVALWDDITQDRFPRVLERGDDPACGIALSSGGHELAAGFHSGRLVRWRLETGETAVFRGHFGEVSDVVFSSDGSIMASAGDDHTVRTWRNNDGAPLWRTAILLGAPYDAALTHEGWRGVPSGQQGKSWQAAVAAAPSMSRYAQRAACIPMSPFGVQLWDLERDAVVAMAAELNVRTLRAVARGCIVVDDAARAWLLTEDATGPVAIADDVLAVGWDPNTPIVATSDRILMSGPDGRALRTVASSALVTAVASVGSKSAVGSDDGLLDVRSWDAHGSPAAGPGKYARHSWQRGLAVRSCR